MNAQSRVWMVTMQREEWLSRKMDGKGERWVVKQIDEWLRLISKQRDECQSRIWMATMQREEWLTRKMDGKGERWVGNQRDGWLGRQMGD